MDDAPTLAQTPPRSLDIAPDPMKLESPPLPRYLWAAARQAAAIPVGKLVEDRYHVVAPQIWLDTKPALLPDKPFPLPSLAMPYAALSAYQLHLPHVYGFCNLDTGRMPIEVALLDNIPVDRSGGLLPSLHQVWSGASALNQAHWLWQIVDLWAPLAGTGVLSSLVLMENIRVDGDRIRLCEIVTDSPNPQDKVTLAKLGSLWLQTLPDIDLAIADRLRSLFAHMQSERASLRDVAYTLNQMLLQQAARLPLARSIAGGSDAGKLQHLNEDSFYPNPLEVIQNPSGDRVAIVCDGVAGHEGGEVASQLAIKMLKLQAQALVKDIAQSGDVVPPDRIASSIAALVRVANNSIASQNNSQGRESRQRMSTTFVMAVQVPQIMNIPGGKGDAHEIYIAHIGDSRAYWITRNRCQLLTLDDDIATREVKQGRDLYPHSSHRPDATCLTQALGTKSGEAIVPSIRRLMALEDGVLVLCSDGLSDRHLIERSWAEFVPAILDGNLPLADAVTGWIDRANQERGDDNISVVLMHCQVASAAKYGSGGYLATTTSKALDKNRSPFSIEFATGKAFRAATLTFVMLGICAAALLGTIILRPEWISNWQERVMPEK